MLLDFEIFYFNIYTTYTQ